MSIIGVMRAFSVTSLGIASATLLLTALPTEAATAAVPAPVGPGPSAPRLNPGGAWNPGGAALPGSTRSLPLTPVTDRGRPAGELGVERRKVAPFSLVGVVWQDPSVPLLARVQVRTRDIATGAWSRWQDLHSQPEHAPETGSPKDSGLRGSTAPLWVGPSDGVQARVRAAEGRSLPAGLRLELVDPGDAPEAAKTNPGGPPAPGTDPVADRGAQAQAPQPEELPELTREETAADARESGRAAAGGHIGPRPGIVTRSGWGADPKLNKGGYLYTRTVRMAFVHHTASSNGYSCSQVPAIIRGIHRYHVLSSGWRDIGYNFLVDKCGKIYEGRAGGVNQPVQGAHTYGFNSNTMGIAVLGSFDSAQPPKAAVEGVAKLTAWKLGLFGVNPRGHVTMTSGGGKYRVGTKVNMHTVSGHRDGYNTACPGGRLYGELDRIRALAARLQGR
jgi:hypothetical protein